MPGEEDHITQSDETELGCPSQTSNDKTRVFQSNDDSESLKSMSTEAVTTDRSYCDADNVRTSTKTVTADRTYYDADRFNTTTGEVEGLSGRSTSESKADFFMPPSFLASLGPQSLPQGLTETVKSVSPLMRPKLQRGVTVQHDSFPSSFSALVTKKDSGNHSQPDHASGSGKRSTSALDRFGSFVRQLSQ